MIEEKTEIICHQVSKKIFDIEISTEFISYFLSDVIYLTTSILSWKQAGYNIVLKIILKLKTPLISILKILLVCFV